MKDWKLESWTVEDLAYALRDMHKEKKVISIPMFQRGRLWDEKQREEFIDSLKKGFPVGMMLFYETYENEKKSYVLVDGLQRGDCIKKYMSNPTDFFTGSNVPDEFCCDLLRILSAETNDNNCNIVRSILVDFIAKIKKFHTQFYLPAKELQEKFNVGEEVIGPLIDAIEDFFKEYNDRHDDFKKTVIPVVIYFGDEKNLPDIFNRINSSGTELTQYELYAAVWPLDRQLYVENTSIVKIVLEKYDSFVDDGFTVYNYDHDSTMSNKRLNIFEYLFGLSKFLIRKYPILAFSSEKGKLINTISTLGFELVNACFNDSDKIDKLCDNINALPNVNAFEKALCSAIDFVADAIHPFTEFKGNRRSSKRILHSKFQIMSMISAVFKEMYKNNEYSQFSDSWKENKDLLEHNLKCYYVYDILNHSWDSGGTKSIYTLSRRYTSGEISLRAWRTVLDSFFDRSMDRNEWSKIASPQNEDYIFLNCVYLNTFTAMNQLSNSKFDTFDIEHIATKKQMKKLINICKHGLPVSCIANLCYLPEYANRSKKGENFYQDKNYKKKVDISEIERKYSFTTESDLEWMDMPYNGPEDFGFLQESYVNFCTKRFSKMKKLFCESMGVDYDAMNSVPEEEKSSPDISHSKFSSNSKDFYPVCLKRVEDMIGSKLVKVKSKIYKTQDGKKGYSFHVSTLNKAKNYDRYWFEYNRNTMNIVSDCEEQYVVYGCSSSNIVVCIPVNIIHERINRMKNSDKNTDRWHVYLYCDANENVMQLLRNPKELVDINQFKI